MAEQSESRWDRLSQHSHRALLVAGFLLAGVAVYKGIGDFTAMSVPSVVDTGYGGLALLSPIVGLLGLYSRVKDAAPRVAKTGIASLGLSVPFVLAIWVEFFGSALYLGRFPRVPEESPAWGVLALVVVFLALSFGFILLGIATQRSPSIPKPVGLLLVVPGLLWISLLVNVFTIRIPNYDFYTYVLIGATVLTIAYRMRTDTDSPPSVTPGSDSAA